MSDMITLTWWQIDLMSAMSATGSLLNLCKILPSELARSWPCNSSELRDVPWYATVIHHPECVLLRMVYPLMWNIPCSSRSSLHFQLLDRLCVSPSNDILQKSSIFVMERLISLKLSFQALETLHGNVAIVGHIAAFFKESDQIQRKAFNSYFIW